MDPHLIIQGGEAIERLLLAARRAPRQTALVCDVDGTISPIAPTPDDARVPAATRSVLQALVGSLGLVAFVTGRGLDDGRRLVAVDGAAYVGAHGLETVTAGGEAQIAPQARPYLPLIRRVAADARRDLDHERLGILLEDKPAGFAAHYRLAPDRDAARHQILTRLADPARAQGLEVMTGHYVMEVRPPLALTKGTATAQLLEQSGCLTALVCGDDLTDVAAFDAAHRWAQRDGRRTACALAALTDETQEPVLAAADAQARATEGVAAVLADLLAAVGG